VIRILQGDCRDVLKTLPDESVHCVVTSPPYFGLRDYGHAGQIGLEGSPEAFVAALVGVFEEVRRVLRGDGTLWLNLGDSYVAPNGRSSGGTYGRGPNSQLAHMHEAQEAGIVRSWGDLPAKNLVGVPWRTALALQAAGWYLRQDIIWHKPNPMPESVTDRCTKSHEYIFLLAKNEHYYFDQDSILEPLADSSLERLAQVGLEHQAGSDRVPGKTNGPMKAVSRNIEGNMSERGITRTTEGLNMKPDVEKLRADGKRNKRSVWTVTTQPFKEAHFATFPPDLIEPCILAGCPGGGTVLDPFGGAGTTGLVADRHGRDAILIELNPEYAAMARKRIYNDAPLFADVA
jgi:DNA modification methylase